MSLKICSKDLTMQIGKISFVFNPSTDDPKSVGLVRVCFDSVEDDDPTNLLQLYSIPSREQAQKLQGLDESSNESKLAYLIKAFGLKLMVANSIPDTCGALISVITNARKGRSRTRVLLQGNKPPPQSFGFFCFSVFL
ncbi:Lysine-specific histone demethylase 1-like protein 2 [Raphanus sativus]|nr:Lysine-specific histone demethylase 1-like protein 2 [Raphanus sativus]